MEVSITFNMVFSWKDNRLKFMNLFDKENDTGNTKILSDNVIEQIWLPMEYVIHDNAILGTIEKDANRLVSVRALAPPIPVDFQDGIENLLYKGSENNLKMAQRFKMTYRCDFELTYYPFDHQICKFVMRLRQTPKKSVNTYLNLKLKMVD